MKKWALLALFSAGLTACTTNIKVNVEHDVPAAKEVPMVELLPDENK